jgi:hypothetical protein
MTYTLIAHTEVGSGGAANITFSSIPATFTDLLLVLSTRAATDTSSLSRLEINGLTTNQTIRYLEGGGSGSGASGTASRIFQIDNSSSFTANTFANVQIYIPNYASTTAAKSFSSDSVSENNATTALQWIAAGLWNSTAAINSIKIEPPSGNFAQYSSATLYGITAGSSGGVVVS